MARQGRDLSVSLPYLATPAISEHASWGWSLDLQALYRHVYSLNFVIATPFRNLGKQPLFLERLLETWLCAQNLSFMLWKHFPPQIICRRLSPTACLTSAATLVAILRPYIPLAVFCKCVCMPNSVLAFAFYNMGMWQLCTELVCVLRFLPSWFPKVCRTWTLFAKYILPHVFWTHMIFRRACDY